MDIQRHIDITLQTLSSPLTLTLIVSRLWPTVCSWCLPLHLQPLTRQLSLHLSSLSSWPYLNPPIPKSRTVHSPTPPTRHPTYPMRRFPSSLGRTLLQQPTLPPSISPSLPLAVQPWPGPHAGMRSRGWWRLPLQLCLSGATTPPHPPPSSKLLQQRPSVSYFVSI